MELCANVVFPGGTTIFQRMVERTTNELTTLAPSTMTSRWLLRFGKDWIYLVYELPDGNIITVGAERFHCVDMLFKPNFNDKGASGIHDTSF